MKKVVLNGFIISITKAQEKKLDKLDLDKNEAANNYLHLAARKQRGAEVEVEAAYDAYQILKEERRVFLYKIYIETHFTLIS